MKQTLSLVILLTAVLSCGPSPQELEQSQVKEFQSLPEEVLQPTRWDDGGTLVSNESRLDLFESELRKRSGGIYLGVGSVQNFTLAAWSKPDYIVLMDFTEIVKVCNDIHIAFFKEAETKEQYLALWKKDRTRGTAILTNYFGNQPDFANYKTTYKLGRGLIPWYFRKITQATQKHKYKVYFQDNEMYSFLRQRALQGRIRAMKGNLVGTTTVRNIGSFSNKHQLPIAMVYTSNAEEYRLFRPYPEVFRKNMQSLMANRNSLIVRTVSFQRDYYPWASGSESLTEKGFHYAVQPLVGFQKWLSKKEVSIYRIFAMSKPGKNGYTYLSDPPKPSS